MNVFTFTGHLGKDCEQKFLQNGNSVVTFSVPCTSGYGTHKATTWVRCSLFGKRGESLAQHLVKGTLVCVSGEFKLNEWEKDGQKRYQAECNVAEITLLGSRQSQGESKPAQQSGDFEDIPF